MNDPRPDHPVPKKESGKGKINVLQFRILKWKKIENIATLKQLTGSSSKGCW